MKDRELLQGLTDIGFKLPEGDLQPSILPLVFERGGGFYVDNGCSSLLSTGKIKHHHTPRGITKFTASSLNFPTSSSPTPVEIPADIVIFATGYGNCSIRTRQIFGEDADESVGDVWGLDDEGELRGVWRRTGHEGFWVAAGGLWISRYYSRVLAMQIALDLKAREAAR